MSHLVQWILVYQQQYHLDIFLRLILQHQLFENLLLEYFQTSLIFMQSNAYKMKQNIISTSIKNNIMIIKTLLDLFFLFTKEDNDSTVIIEVSKSLLQCFIHTYRKFYHIFFSADAPILNALNK